MSITLEKLGKLRVALSELPKADEFKQEVDTRKAVDILRKDINALKRKGYTLEMIAEQLRAGGLSVSPTMLRRYMRRRARGTKAAQTRTNPSPHPQLQGIDAASGSARDLGDSDYKR